ncbi:D-alanine--D-alanine ligase family protein [Dysosmobacter sp.]|uniref:D-alanine--D-alanine ligase family protein n=1 Tax=Dysosmobacter sp. TaxID=2591382 RepID=UPI002A89B894|nr:D-alanine--D-alanine ligase [Dysosmobacter sp.]MDY3281513.1 D-alanine--D-alanine ligase [Dysosmobacter sp.]
MKIVVLAGGLSTERGVSLASGAGACRALRENGHRAIFVDMFLGLPALPDPAESVFDAPDGLCPEASIAPEAPDLEAVRASRPDKSPSLLGPNVLEVCRMADLVFLGLHGMDGEDGRIQATLDLLGVPYTGSGYLASAMAMDKVVTKRMMDSLGIPTPAWRVLTYGPEEAEALSRELPMPCVVKTVDGGSSLGVFLPADREELKRDLLEVLKFGSRVLVEQRVYGRELVVGVLGDRYLPSAMTIPANGNFDYVAKYQTAENGGARELCPAPITPEEQELVGQLALKLYHGLGLQVYARADVILDDAGQPWFLEFNSLPGLTPASFMPKEAAAAGMTYNQLIEDIVQQSVRIRRR